jgi:hypothetical protein
MLPVAAFSKETQSCFILGDSQEYPIAYQWLVDFPGGQTEDDRMARKAERNALGIDWKIARTWLIQLRRNLHEHRAHRISQAAGKCVCGGARG